VLAEVGIVAHERPHYCAHVGLALVLDRVDEGVFLCLRLDPLAEFVVHYRAVRASGGKLVRIRSDRLERPEGIEPRPIRSDLLAR